MVTAPLKLRQKLHASKSRGFNPLASANLHLWRMDVYFDIKDEQIPIIYSSHYDIHFMGMEKLHPFDSAKWGKIFHFLESAHIISKDSSVEPVEASKEVLLVVHPQEYLNKLKWSIYVARITEVPCVSALPNSLVQRKVLKPFRFQTGGTILAGKLALERGWALNIGGGFHHCSSDQGGGFCAYADITLCIKFVFEHQKDIKKVMIVDLDAHQGNGHERDFMGDDRVYILDIYNRGIYPRDEYAKGAINKKVELRHMTEDDEYLEKVSRNLNASLEEFSPQFIVYNAGTDILKGDPLGCLSITPQMYQRKEKSDRIAGGHEDVLVLFKLLESSDPEEVENVTNVIHENLSAAKDSRWLNCIVNHHLTVHSKRSLDILVRVKDPHDKHLFDKINELMKSETTCYESLQLLCNLIYKQPSWIYKIANHRLMHTLFNLLKNDTQAPNLISALLIIVCLLPMIPSQFGPFLTDTFEVFSRLIAWNVKKPSAISEAYVLHLQVGVYSLFHRLYGMFPCNFLAYLRSYYGGREYSEENTKVFNLYIKPMLERVRLHPLLVTASKDTELSFNRWKKMEYHDVITDCASISLDAIEGTLEGLRGRTQNPTTLSRRHGHFSAQSSLQYASLSSQSSITSANLEVGNLVTEAVVSHRDSLWSPSHFSSSPAASTLHITTATGYHKNVDNSQLSIEETVPLDLAVEAKPEELKLEEEHRKEKEKLSKTPSTDSKSDLKSSEKSDKISSICAYEDFSKSSEKDTIEESSLEFIGANVDEDILQGVEAKEEGDTDKEVSELTSIQNQALGDTTTEQRHDTPFCSTTQNLTAEPNNRPTCEALKAEKLEETLTKSQDDADEMYNSMQDEEPFVTSFTSRYRYLSQCGPPPIIPSECPFKPKVVRSVSCPAKFCPTSQSSTVPETTNVSDVVSSSDTIVTTCSNSVVTTSGAFMSFSNNVILTATRNFTYEQLFPMAMDPLPDISQPPNASLESNYYSCNALFNSLSPPELLDNYIQIGSVSYTNQASCIPITSTKNTDWTHFGGKPPPDEVDILRTQILLLHNQLLFERHRKDVHSERIRRILGRAKKAKMQEELVIALKEQITLLEKDNENLKHELTLKTNILEKSQCEIKMIQAELNDCMKKYKSDNIQISYSNMKLQDLLVSQKEENDEIIAKCKSAHSKIMDLGTELDLWKQEVDCCRKLKKEAEFVSKQLFLMQDINNLYKCKIEELKNLSNPNNIGADLYNKAAAVEIQDLKKKLESTCFHLDAVKSKNVELEQILNDLKQKEKEHYKVIDRIKAYHQDKIKVCDEHLTEHKRISIQKDALILQLHKEKEILSEQISTLEKKINGASNIANESCDKEIPEVPHSSADH